MIHLHSVIETLKLNSSLAWTVTSHQYFKIALFFCIVFCRLKRKKKETVGVCLELFMHKYMAHPALQSMGSDQTKYDRSRQWTSHYY